MLSDFERRHSHATYSAMSHVHHLIWPTVPQQQTRQREDPAHNEEAEMLRKCFKGWKRDQQLSVWMRARNWQCKGKGRVKGAGKGHAKLTEDHGVVQPASTGAMGSAGVTSMSSVRSSTQPPNEILCRPCVDCGTPTENCCDASPQHCLAAQRMPAEPWARNQLTPLCPTCDEAWGMCRFCRADRILDSDTNNLNALSGCVDILGQATLRGLDVTYTMILDLLQQQPLNAPDQ